MSSSSKNENCEILLASTQSDCDGHGDGDETADNILNHSSHTIAGVWMPSIQNHSTTSSIKGGVYA